MDKSGPETLGVTALAKMWWCGILWQCDMGEEHTEECQETGGQGPEAPEHVQFVLSATVTPFSKEASP